MKRIEETRLASFGNAKPYKTMTSEGMRLVKPPTMLIEGFMAEGFVCGLTSYPGVGKTWLALAIAKSAGTGEALMGQFKVVGGPTGVLVIGSDSSEADYAQQWTRLTEDEQRAWEASFDPEHDEVPPKPFRRVHFLIQSPFMLDNTDEVKRVILTALDESRFPRQQTVIDGEVVKSAKGGCGLIVMDTLSRLTVANQNDNTEMERVFANVRTICEVTGAAVLLLHHNSKATEFNDGADWRGAMSQIGALDSWIQLANSKRNRNKIRAQFKKFRGIKPPDFEYQQNVNDPERANVVYLGMADAPVARDNSKDDLLLTFTVWRSKTEVEDLLWPTYETKFGTREKFSTFLKNAINELVADNRLEARPRKKAPDQKGRPFNEYLIKQTTPCATTSTTDSSTPTTSSEPMADGSIPMN